MVADISQKEIREMLYVRATLEGMAAGLACTNMTQGDLQQLASYQAAMEKAVSDGNVKQFSANNEQFHQLIFEKSGNHFLHETINNLMKRSWHEPSTSWKGLGDISRTMNGHQQILDAIAARNVAEARSASEKHTLDAITMNESLNQTYEEAAGSLDA